MRDKRYCFAGMPATQRATRGNQARTSTLRCRAFAVAASGILAASVAAFSTVTSGDPPPADVGIKTLSSRADLVSGGDALVQITLKHENRNHPVSIILNGYDVASAFRPGDAPDTMTGLVTGLNLGKNTLQVQGNGSSGLKNASLEITNYPITGPIISGPHEVPYICTTEDFQIYSGVLGLLVPDTTTFGPSLDADCSAATKITYLYMPVGGTTLVPLPSTSSLPADVAKTTTTTGETVNFVVRVETSTINRGIYQSTILHDPTSDPAPNWFSPPRGWNKRLIAIEGAGCPGGWYFQGTEGGSLTDLPLLDASLFSPTLLGEGYALFGNTLQNASQSCNQVLSGETAMMGKEHFIKSFGVPFYTVSIGGSGGSYGSSQLVDALPGLFDGVFITAVFPDPLGIAFSGADGHLLTHYFTVTNPTGFTIAQQIAVSGYKTSSSPLLPQQAWYDAANQSGRIDPVPGRVDVAGYVSATFSPVVPVSLQYNPVTNPHGARPTVFDISRNIYGVNPTTGFALRPFDNVGVQYGLAALNAGQITVMQFLALNQFIGGYDQDFNYVPNRVVGDAGAILRMGQSGLQLGGNGGLASIPVFVYGYYDDDSGYHYQWHRFAMRARMAQANGNADNYVMWRGAAVPLETAFSTFVQWMETVAADQSDRSQREKVIADKPLMAVDGCWSSATNFIAEPQTFSSLPDSQCNTLFPSYAFPRYIAGGPVAANITKCQLKALDPNDYTVPFTSEELSQLQQIFPNGVCDWSLPGVNQTGVIPWASFGPSPDNLVFDITK
jgi:hypothetical protein